MKMRQTLRFGVSLASSAMFFVSACTTTSVREPAAVRSEAAFLNRAKGPEGVLNSGKNMSQSQGSRKPIAKKFNATASPAVGPYASTHQYMAGDLRNLSAKDLKADALKAILQEDGAISSKERSQFLGPNKSILVADAAGAVRNYVPTKEPRGAGGARDEDRRASSALGKDASIGIAMPVSRLKSYDANAEAKNYSIHPNNNKDLYSSAQAADAKQVASSPKSQSKVANMMGSDPGAGTIANPSGKTAGQKSAGKAGTGSSQPKDFYDDYYEPNDFLSSAYDLSYWENLWLSGLHGSGFQCNSDYYEVWVAPGWQNLKVDLRFNDYDGDIDLEVLNDSGSRVASSTSTDDDEYINVNLTYSGRYYIRAYYGNSCNSYDLKWSTSAYGSGSDDRYEQNDYRSEAYDLRSVENLWLYNVRGLGIAADEDYYKIQVDAGYQRLIVDLQFTHSYGDIDMKVYDANGYQVATSTSSSDDEYIDVGTLASPLPPGIYYIKVYPYLSSPSNPNSYDMKWYTVRTNPGAVSEDGYEPNDFRSTSNPLISQNNEIRAAQWDDDYFRINVDNASNRRVKVDLRFTHSYGDIDMKLYDSNGVELQASLSSTNSEFIDVSVASVGTYYIRVFGDNLGNEYRLLWYPSFSGPQEDNYEQNDTLASAYNLSLDPNKWLSSIRGLGSQQDDDWFKLNVPEGLLRLTVDLRTTYSVGHDIDIKLYDSTNHEIVGSFNSSDDELIDWVVPSAGTYYVRVYGDNAGDNYDMKYSVASQESLIRVATTGSYYEPRTSGQGFNVEFVARETGPDELVVYWYTYDPFNPSPNGIGTWYVAQGQIQGSRAQMSVYKTQNGVFNQRPVNVDVIPVGTATFEVSNCSTATFDYSFTNAPPWNLSGRIPLSRLTAPIFDRAGRNICTGRIERAPNTAVQPIMKGHTGSYYNPAISGQGFNFEYSQNSDNDPVLIFYWYTYDPLNPNPGSRAQWIVGSTVSDDPQSPPFHPGDSDVHLKLFTVTNGVFNTASTVSRNTFGYGKIHFDNCNYGTFTFSTVSGSGANYQNVTIPMNRLTPPMSVNGTPLCISPAGQ